MPLNKNYSLKRFQNGTFNFIVLPHCCYCFHSLKEICSYLAGLSWVFMPEPSFYLPSVSLFFFLSLSYFASQLLNNYQIRKVS